MKEIIEHLTLLNFSVDGGVAIVKMNNPPVNALTPGFLDEFKTVLDHITAEQKIRALLLTSQVSGFFSAGDDISQLQDFDKEILEELPRVHQLMNRIEALPIPTIAAVNGHALGGGLELALTCDFRFMAANSGYLGLPEVRLGMIPAFGGTQRLPLFVGRTKAIEMMYEGSKLSSEQAKDIGLINDVYEVDVFSDSCTNYARRLSFQATAAIARIKRCVLAGQYEGAVKGLEMERIGCEECFDGVDAREGVTAFLSGKKPNFEGIS